MLAELARQLDPPGRRRAVEQLVQLADPDGADGKGERGPERRGGGCRCPGTPWWRWVGCWNPRPASWSRRPWRGWPSWPRLGMPAGGSQRTAAALAALCRRALEGGGLPSSGGVRPAAAGHRGPRQPAGPPVGGGGEAGWAGPLPPEACRRLACDAAVTRVLVDRQPVDSGVGGAAGCRCPDTAGGIPGDPGEASGLAGRLRAAVALLPPVLGGGAQPAPGGRPLDSGALPAQPAALAVRDHGGVFPGLCSAPGLVRRASSGVVACWWPDRPGQSGPVVPGPSPGRA